MCYIRRVNEANVLKGVSVTVNYCSAITDVVETNIQKVLINNDSSCSTPVKLWSLKVDELSVEGRLRYGSETNEVVGMCCQHSKKSDVVFTNSQFVSNLEDGLNHNSLHLASESCVFDFSVLGKTGYRARPFLSFPICSHNTADQQEIIFENILSTWDDSFSDHLINIGTDGDGVSRSVLHNLRTETLDPSSPLYCQLEDLVTFEKSRTIHFDAKHISERWRSITISGSIKIFGKMLDPSTLKRYFESVGKTDAELSPLLNPTDKQNVPLAVKLLQLFIDDVGHQNLPPDLRDLALAFQVMKVV